MTGNKLNIPLVDICNLSEHKEDSFLVSRFGSYLEKHQNLQLAHRHSFYHLVFFTKGAGFHTIDFAKVKYKILSYYTKFHKNFASGRSTLYFYKIDFAKFEIHFAHN